MKEYILNKVFAKIKTIFLYIRKNKFVNLDKASAKEIDSKWNRLLYIENERNFQNLSSFFPQNIQNKKEFEKIKESFRNWLNAPEYHVVFTSGATESLNMAFKGIVFERGLYQKNDNKKYNIVLSKVEHKAVLEIAKYLGGIGVETRYIPILKTGIIDKRQIKKLVDKNTILLSIPLVNNETGNYQPMEGIKEMKMKFHFLFHCDISAVVNYGPIDLVYYGIDLASFSAHKMCGIKGLGCLLLNNTLNICPIIHGGGQQLGIRGGTENFPAIKVWGAYINLKINNYRKEQEKINRLDDYLIEKLQNEFEKEITFNSLICKSKRIPGIVNVSLKGFPNLKLTTFLANKNIFVGTGSACNHLQFEDSIVIDTMGLSKEEIDNVIRISFDENNNFHDFDRLVENIKSFKHTLNYETNHEKDESDLPDCESYRKLAFKYLIKKLKS